jgi:pyruvate/2-oxoglutarate/acetoin dehydrogenase E1 component
VVVFAPIGSLTMREDLTQGDLVPVPLGTGRIHREGHDVTVVAIGHLVYDALVVAGQLEDQVSIEVFDPRTLYPFDWDGLAASLAKTGRLVVIDDTNRTCGMAAEILATAAEEMRLLAPPRRITRPDGAILGFAPELDLALQPGRHQLADMVLEVVKAA